MTQPTWLDEFFVSGGGSTPTGTGVPKIVGGVQSAAASLIVNADVDAAAAIAASKVVQATGTGIPHVVAGALSAASSLIVNADVDAAAAIAVAKLAPGANTQVLTTTGGVTVWAAPSGGGASAGATAGQVQTGDGVGGFTAPTNVLAGANYVSIGATPATTGAIRLANDTAIISRDAGNSADLSIVKLSSGNAITVGQQAAGGPDIRFNMPNAGSFVLATGSYVLDVTESVFATGVPITGGGGATVTSPYGVHGVGVQAMADANQTVSASVYCYGTIKLTSTTQTIDRTLTLPAATDAAAYTKRIDNSVVGTGSGGLPSVIVTTGAGTAVPLLAGERAQVLVDSRGVTRLDTPGAYGMRKIDLTGLSTYTLTADDFRHGLLYFYGEATGNACTIYVPHPQTAGQAYFRTVDCSASGSTDVYTFSKQYNGTSSGPSVALDNQTRGVWFTPDGLVESYVA